MPDFLEGRGEEEQGDVLDDEEEIEAGLLAELDDDEDAAAQETPETAPPEKQEEDEDGMPHAGRPAASRHQQQQPQQHPVAEQPLPLTADGYVDMDRLTAQQRQKVTNTIVGLMTDEQLDRYEAFRRSSLKRPMRQLVKVVTASIGNPNDKLLIAVSSVAKTFVGDLVETARLVASERGDEGPLQPLHVHAAYQRLKEHGKMPGRGGATHCRRPFR